MGNKAGLNNKNEIETASLITKEDIEFFESFKEEELKEVDHFKNMETFFGFETNKLLITESDESILDKLKKDLANFDYFTLMFLSPKFAVSKFISVYSKIFARTNLYFFTNKNALINSVLAHIELDKTIIIIPCYAAKELIPILNKIKSVEMIFIYCFTHQEHPNWKQKYSKIKHFVKTNEEFVNYLLKYKSNIFFHDFCYTLAAHEKALNLSIEYNIENIANSPPQFINEQTKHLLTYIEQQNKIYNMNLLKTRNTFYTFCWDCIILCRESKKNDTIGISLFSEMPDYITSLDTVLKGKKRFVAEMLMHGLAQLSYLCLYFSKFPYLFCSLPDEKLTQIIKQNLAKRMKLDNDDKLKDLCIFNNFILVQKIAKNYAVKILEKQSLLEEPNLQEFQESLIAFIILCSKPTQNWELKYPCTFLRDIDFCLKFSYLCFFQNFVRNSKENQRLIVALQLNDERINLFKESQIPINSDLSGEIKILNNSIKTKDIIIIGDKNNGNKFHELMLKIKLPCEKAYFFSYDDLEINLKNPRKIGHKYKIMSYFLVIDEEMANKHLFDFNFLSVSYGINFTIVILWKSRNLLLNKNIFKYKNENGIKIDIVFNEKELLNYFINYRDSNIGEPEFNNVIKKQNRENYVSILNGLKFPKSSIMGEGKDTAWNIINDFDIDIYKLLDLQFNNEYENSLHNVPIQNGLSKEMLSFLRDAYLEHEAEELFLQYYAKYFGFSFLCGNYISEITFIKQFLYLYSLEESNKKSMKEIMNNDLCSGEHSKIIKYALVLKTMIKLLNQQALKSFEGIVYRAAYFSFEMIKKVKPGEKLINCCFWNANKDLETETKILMQDYEMKRIITKNVIMYIKANTLTNIDLNECNCFGSLGENNQVLFFPYLSFVVKSFEKNSINNIEYFLLELDYLNENNKLVEDTNL